MLIAVEICSRITNSLPSTCSHRIVTACGSDFLGKEKIPDEARLPEFVGILRVEAGGPRVERAAGEDFPGLGARQAKWLKSCCHPAQLTLYELGPLFQLAYHVV